MQVKVERLGKASFTVHSRDHLLLSDQPKSNGGSDTAMAPPELFLASLGTCVGYYVAQYCDTRHLSCDTLEVEVDGEIVQDPARVGKIAIHIKLPVELDDPRLAALYRAATHCTIHNTLTHPPEIDIQIQTPATVSTSVAKSLG